MRDALLDPADRPHRHPRIDHHDWHEQPGRPHLLGPWFQQHHHRRPPAPETPPPPF